MSKNEFMAHPITVFYLLRSWWIAFTAPIVRMTLQYVISKEAQKILLSEIVLLMVVCVISVIGWISTKIIIYDNRLIIKRGIFIKSQTIINFSKIIDISVSKNLFYVMMRCERCCFNTVSEKKSKIYLTASVAKRVFDAVYDKTKLYEIKRQKEIKRYFMLPISLLLVEIVVLFLQTTFVWKLSRQQVIIYIILFLLIIDLLLIRYFDYKYGMFCCDKNVFVKTVSLFNVKKLHCCKSNVGFIKISQNPFDRRHKTCKINVTMSGEGGATIKIKYIMFENIVEKIKEELNISE